ncbi:iron-containing alcohol dehydrogenase [Plebeiibacterium sediminum]|uniref:Iron-containing alcohol dehydrogenase n=1 Tax=Plebeiibacterium sediminum TaxID=2992112 RepID=A0AAE3M5L5_9BACT|nr:iron-containing alcohol dehydrogenase [Plebeiobacterium sediminum]MCW3787075.1 iron-containing alcohol dehydrogenase [Plebeiobacterium sediminum]
MKNFVYQAGTKILFGKNQVNNLVDEVLTYSNRVLITYGKNSVIKSGLLEKVTSLFKEMGVFYKELNGIQPNPRISSVRDGIRLCRENDLGFILALGGGSVIDASKAMAAGVNYDGDAWDFCLRKAVVKNPLPIGCALTLAATGSEMNGNAVISNDETQEKLAMGSDLLRPKVSMLDPTYTFSVNKWQTAAGTVDIMSHIFEQYFTPDKGTDIQDNIAESIVRTCIKYGPIAIREPENYEARANLMWASSLALNGLTSTGKMMGDWATHGIEHEVSAIYDLTHGAGLAIIFPYWMEYVLTENTAYKFARLGRNVFNILEEDELSAAKQTIMAIRSFFNSLDMPSKLSEVDIPDEYFKIMGDKACKFGPIGYFKRLNNEAVTQILMMAK